MIACQLSKSGVFLDFENILDYRVKELHSLALLRLPFLPVLGLLIARWLLAEKLKHEVFAVLVLEEHGEEAR